MRNLAAAILACFVSSCGAQEIVVNDEIGVKYIIPYDSKLEYSEGKAGIQTYVRILSIDDLPGGAEQFNNIKENMRKEVYPDIPNMPTDLVVNRPGFAGDRKV